MRAVRTAEIVVVVGGGAGEGVCNALVVLAEFTGVLHVDLVVGTIYIVRCVADGEVGRLSRRAVHQADVSAGRDDVTIHWAKPLTVDAAFRVLADTIAQHGGGGSACSSIVGHETLVFLQRDERGIIDADVVAVGGQRPAEVYATAAGHEAAVAAVATGDGHLATGDGDIVRADNDVTICILTADNAASDGDVIACDALEV